MATRSGKLTRILGGMGLVALASFGSQAEAALVFDIRLADGTKAATATSAGQVFNYDVWATVTGLDPDTSNEGFASAAALIRSVGALNGNLTHSLLDPFNATGSNAGAAADRDGDGDMDIGGDGTRNDRPGNITYRAASIQPGNGPFRLGTGTFTVGSTLTGQTAITLLIGSPQGGLNLNPIFRVDNVPLNGATGANQVSVGAPIVISGDDIPPPPAIAELGATPFTPTFTLNVEGSDGKFVTPNPLNAGDELPAGGINRGGVVINGIPGDQTPLFILLGLSEENDLDGATIPGGGTLVSETDANFMDLKRNYPWLDALLRFDGDADRNFNFDFAQMASAPMVTEIAAVPEPTVLGLASLAGLGLLVRRRRNA